MIDIPRLSGKEMLILRSLVDRGKGYGLELVKASKGELKRGTVYVTLNRMLEKGYVESQLEEPGPDQRLPLRRLYWASDYGIRVLEAWETLGANFALGRA